jgi:hypothetical protein
MALIAAGSGLEQVGYDRIVGAGEYLGAQRHRLVLSGPVAQDQGLSVQANGLAHQGLVLDGRRVAVDPHEPATGGANPTQRCGELVGGWSVPIGVGDEEPVRGLAGCGNVLELVRQVTALGPEDIWCIG